MKRFSVFVMSLLAIVSCGRKSVGNFDIYPVPDGEICEMRYEAASTEFRLWSPMAESVKLSLYDVDIEGDAVATVDMKKGRKGVWKCTVKGNLKGKFYTFNVQQNGKWMGETPGIFAVAVGRNGQRAAVVDLKESDPEGWAEDISPKQNSFSDIIIYEMHHRDFSIGENSGIEHRGKFLALTEKGTAVRASGATLVASTGIDHLVELGVTHVHILPSFDFGSIDETRLEDNVYNWGYDPVNYNVPEGSYSTDPADPLCRIREFKQMVQALHNAGLRVVLDVVYNHTFNTAQSPFERTCPGYFYRQKEDGTYSDGSGCGNETASDRTMMRKYMIESMLHWVKEYHIDGFRVDLMGIHDIETMNEIRAALDEVDPTIFLYGEGWAASSPAYPATQLAMKANVAQMPRIAAFSDEIRDCLRGPWSDNERGGFLIGDPGLEAGVKFGICGAIENPESNDPSLFYEDTPWAAEPTQMISYVSCHDDMCLADRLKVTLPDATDADRKALVKLAETIVLCSQGVPFIFAGDEIMRDKKGVHNSYNSPDEINAIDWTLKLQNRDLFDYISEVIKIRKSHPEMHLGSANEIRQRLHFIDTNEDNLIAFTIDNAQGSPTMTIAFNSRLKKAEITIPEGEWQVLCYDGEANADGLGKMRGGLINLPARSALILAR